MYQYDDYDHTIVQARVAQFRGQTERYLAGDVKLLVTEGNYLLLGTAPWWRIKPLLDLSVFLDVPREKLRARLMRRHAAEGLVTEERNREHIERVDLANYDLVLRSRGRADIAIDLLTES